MFETIYQDGKILIKTSCHNLTNEEGREGCVP